MSKTFASQADLRGKEGHLQQALRQRLRLHRRGRPEHRHDRRRRRGDGDRHAGHAGDGAGRDPPHPRGHRQADQVRRAEPLPRGARARRERPTRPSTSSPASDTYDLIVERGEQDKASEIGRFPRLFQAVEIGAAGHDLADDHLHRPMTLWLGKLEVQLMQLGRGHTKGDTVAWLPEQKILFSGDLVEFDATPVRRRRLLPGLAEDAGRDRRAEAARAGAGPRRGADDARAGRRRAWPARATSSPTCAPA